MARYFKSGGTAISFYIGCVVTKACVLMLLVAPILLVSTLLRVPSEIRSEYRRPVNGNGHTFDGNGAFYWVSPTELITQTIARMCRCVGRSRRERWGHKACANDENQNIRYMDGEASGSLSLGATCSHHCSTERQSFKFTDTSVQRVQPRGPNHVQAYN